MLGTPACRRVLTSDADFRVAIDVQIFESAPGDAATLSAMWTVRRVKDGKTDIGRTSVREASSEKGYEALAAAHSRALGRLSADIADAIRALERAGLWTGLRRQRHDCALTAWERASHGF